MRYRALLFVVVAWTSLATGCFVGEPVDGTPQPNLLILDESVAARLLVEPDRLTVDSGAAGPLAQVVAGDVIISNGPEPFLRKVVAITTQAGQLALQTEPAALTEAILDGHAHSTRDLLSETGSPGPGGATELIIPVDKLALNFGGTKLIDDGDLQVRLNAGTVSFRPYLDVDLKIARGNVSHFHAILHGDLTASMGVSITAGRSFSRGFSKTLWQSPPYTATQFIGLIPVVEVVRVSLVLSGEAHANASGSIDLGSATATASLEAGATYDAGRWQATARPSIEFKARGPSAEASVSAGASMRLSTRVDVKFYDIAGPHLTVGAYARTELSGSLASGIDWTGRVGMDGAFGGNIAVLGKTLASYDRALFDLGRNFSLD